MAENKIAKLAVEQIQDLATQAKNEGAHSVALEALRHLSERPGVKTSEFYFSIASSVVGTALLAVPGKEVYGLILSAVSVLAYNLSRGIAKT